MKVLLALSLLLFLDFVFSQGDFFTCPTFGSCPDGYTPQYSGRNMLNAVCQCKKKQRAVTPCELSIAFCSTGKRCSEMESICPLTEIINACNDGELPLPVRCDRANQRLRKENYAKTQRTCESYRDKCNRILGDHCITAAATCDPDTTIQLCKNKRITDNHTCEEAEIQKEKERAEDTKYSCNSSQVRCLAGRVANVCRKIPKFCDVETAAMWCYKYDMSELDIKSDKKCSKLVKKSQYLMFGQSKPECWTQLPLCEKGNSKACMQVGTFCVKEIVSALCHANKIADKRICTFAGSEKTTSPSYPGCKFFADKCNNLEDNYCQLASRYCDNDTIDELCRALDIRDPSVCRRVDFGDLADILTVSHERPDYSTIELPDFNDP